VRWLKSNENIEKLKIPTDNVAMVGDNFEKDIKPAIAVGIQPFWFREKYTESVPDNVKVIKQLSALYI
jgi:FMN phosphatase YigB (HAD superfamily)